MKKLLRLEKFASALLIFQKWKVICSRISGFLVGTFSTSGIDLIIGKFIVIDYPSLYLEEDGVFFRIDSGVRRLAGNKALF